MMRNTITLADFKLRLFLDTNVLIDYVVGYNGRNSVNFLNFFKKSKIRKKSRIEDIELVTSDYVLWEFYGHMREELYAKKLVSKYKFGLIAANKECRNGNFKKADRNCMKSFGKKIKETVNKMADEEQIFTEEKLIGRSFIGFSEIVEEILQCSKFSYKDAIVLASVFYTYSNWIITCDEQHFNKNRLKELEEAIKDFPLTPGQPVVKKPGMFPQINDLRVEYKRWFLDRNDKKILGDIEKYYPRWNVVEVKCRGNNFIEEGDIIWLVRFIDDKMIKLSCPVKKGNLRGPISKKPKKKGKHVTIKLPYQKKNWDKGIIFLDEERMFKGR